MTVLEGIQKSAEFLTKKGVESPRLQAELLLADVLKLPRMKLYLNFERALAPAEVDQFRERIRRRGQREPLQHIIGFTSFCGLDIAVNRHVLVPRPETELLAETGWKFLSSLDANALAESATTRTPTRIEAGHAPTALDYGTGSGCIAIALAANCPGAPILALDDSPDALAVARENAARNKGADRIEFLQGDSFAALPHDSRFDLIISNPPYIPTAEIDALEPEVRDYDPRRALDGGPDGLEFFRRIASEARPFASARGRLMVEFGDGQADAVRKIFEDQKWVVTEIKDDYTQRPRILTARL